MADDYIKKADAYKIALHDGSDLAAQKIADLKPEPVKPDNDMYEIVKNMVDGMITMRFTPDFEKAFAEMRGEHDG